MKKTSIIAALGMMAALAGCHKAPAGWTVEGNIEGADGDRLALEAFNSGGWYVIDSISTGNDGAFSYTAAAPAAYPEIMRLSLDGVSVYFPVDSVDHITVAGTAAAFDRAKVSGSHAAAAMQSLDSLINATVTSSGKEAVLTTEVKRDLVARALADTTAISLYYLMNKTVGNTPIFSTDNAADVRYYGALAQRFATEYPDDPRTAYLAGVYSSARQAHLGKVTEIAVPVATLFDIKRYDSAGKEHSLAEMASRGGVTLLSFTTYDSENSAAYNVLLNNAWDKYHGAGLDIYQLAFDDDETMWKIRAANLPWTAVWNSLADGNDVLLQYNVGVLPMTFIIDREGNLAERVTDPTQLQKSLAKYF
ncbi:MAG: DUF4369 domain-containing protein [Muribaculaceae bacterium]|nr:DUF4369 domain-containing protein [Muribaculaceae bacterium]